jgi:hypothetical protein
MVRPGPFPPPQWPRGPAGKLRVDQLPYEFGPDYDLHGRAFRQPIDSIGRHGTTIEALPSNGFPISHVPINIQVGRKRRRCRHASRHVCERRIADDGVYRLVPGTSSASRVRQCPRSSEFRSDRCEAPSQLTIRGHDDHTASTRDQGCGDPHDFVVAGRRGGDDIDAVGRGDTAGLALHDQDHLMVVGQWLKGIAKPYGRAVPVTPPAVWSRADDIGRVNDQNGKRVVHLTIVACRAALTIDGAQRADQMIFGLGLRGSGGRGGRPSMVVRRSRTSFVSISPPISAR